MNCRRLKIKKAICCLFVCVLLTPVYGFAAEKAENLLVIVTTDDSVTQFMSLTLARLAKKKGTNVDVLLCGAAGSLGMKGSPEVLLKPKNKSPQMLLKGLIQSGINVEICPPYLPNAGKTASDLTEGVVVAKPLAIADKLIDMDTKILSY